MKKVIAFLFLINLLTFEIFSEESMQYSDAIEEINYLRKELLKSLTEKNISRARAIKLKYIYKPRREIENG